MAKQRTDTESVLKLVVNGQQAKTSAKEIADAYRKVTAELNNMRKADNPAAYAEKARNVKTLKDALADARKEVSGFTNESKKFQTSWKEIAKGMVAGFGINEAIGMIKNFGQQVFDTSVKFQKLEAVLTTTLGSNSQAKLVMGQIQDFASKTPFQVDELTDSYVRLANQGFKPTMEQLRQLGDLSASTGKDFTQLTEAIIDAQTGEFERLKEFGIRASKNGDQVAFTFKGVTQEVNFTADAIRDYITALGDVEGISGSMAAISETLGGKVSNLGDSWEGLLKTVGEETEGVFSFAITLMNEAISSITNYISALNEAQKYNAPGTSFFERLSELGTLNGPVNIQAIKRQAFADVSKSIDQQIGGAKNFKDLQNLFDDLRGRMKAVDRTTREGAAAYALYADKLKVIADRGNELKKDRSQEVMKGRTAAAKEAAVAAEKARKEAEKQAKAQEKALQKEYDGLKKMAEQMQLDFKIDSLSGLDQKLAEIAKKYDPLIEKAKKFKDAALVGIFTNLKKGEGLAAEKADWEKQAEDATKNREKKFKEDVDNLALEYDKRGVENINKAQSDEELENLDYKLEEERLIALKLLYEAYGEDAVEFERALATRKLAERERLNQGHKELAESEIETERAVWETMEAGVSMLKGLVDSTTGMYKAMIVVEKAVAIAKIVMNTQAEISGYYAKYALVPGGPAIASALAANAKIRAGLSIGVVAATGIAEVAASGKKKEDSTGANASSSKKYSSGGVPDGPSHDNGGIKLVHGITGETIGEMEGGERILSKRETRLLDDILYSGQRKLSQQYSVNAAGALEAENRLRYGGGTALTSNGVRSSDSYNYSQTVDLRSLEERMDKFIEVAESAWNYRLFEKKRREYERAFEDLNS